MPNVVNKDLLAAAREAATEAGVINTVAAVAECVERLQTGEIEPDGLAAHLALAAAKNPEWWKQPDADKGAGDEHGELIELAFVGKGNATARGKLVKLIGEQAANEQARKFSVSSIADFKSVGKAPEVDPAVPKDKRISNPFEDDTAAGEGRRIAFIKSAGTAKATSLAHSAGRTITGQPLFKTVNG
jgi:hypothetical protein